MRPLKKMDAQPSVVRVAVDYTVIRMDEKPGYS
ncbi:hypothetical protein MNBD_GAMMA19-1796 [hydrothermal vent metagenome]|uniref:Uncharacterized protein n=1 Tax=hydrothermal vent metagenome TaxID=652676 RepID=A0A3B1A7N7_9ZZZZ